ncbi:hypothetical protein [Neptunicella sp. SCSIO 80796]|uniref:hypothetical protein n=1 Tax=Neptunicella plasticusilytica TaxID=3117012 RepID=UPI003A4DBCB6
MSKIVFSSVISVLALSACATNPANNFADEQAELAKNCQELKVKISDLWGKPIRRTEMRRRYDLECLSEFSAGDNQV